MDIDYDAIRYARDWRYGRMIAPHDEEGYVERVNWLAFPTSEDRAKYIEDMRENGLHIDILSEQEIAVAIGVKSREQLWDYFALQDPDFVLKFQQERCLAFYGKADPRAQAPSHKS